ncbi:MAG: abortive infection family protein [Nitrospirae bacterium]|nr:abortive infection family protein [Nitrospirota bacterium]
MDRLHTALHGYLRVVCGDANIKVDGDASLTDLFKQLRERHPAFRDLGPRSGDILRVLRALGSILDTLNPLRNKASLAHPNPVLLPGPEAMLAINAALSILHYVDEKVHRNATGSS